MGKWVLEGHTASQCPRQGAGPHAQGLVHASSSGTELSRLTHLMRKRKMLSFTKKKTLKSKHKLGIAEVYQNFQLVQPGKARGGLLTLTCKT